MESAQGCWTKSELLPIEKFKCTLNLLLFRNHKKLYYGTPLVVSSYNGFRAFWRAPRMRLLLPLSGPPLLSLAAWWPLFLFPLAFGGRPGRTFFPTVLYLSPLSGSQMWGLQPMWGQETVLAYLDANGVEA